MYCLVTIAQNIDYQIDTILALLAVKRTQIIAIFAARYLQVELIFSVIGNEL